MPSLHTSAKVQLTIEIDDVGSWSAACTAQQVFDQAESAAINRVQKAFAAVGKDAGVRLVGAAKVIAISYEVK